jgi:pyruvate ferredoxin oxidoreductase gamma subunit
VLGTAAFLEGFQAQDSPIYGAERRGAPVAAFTRIDREPIRERGLIARPHLLIVGDASLIQDAAARVLDGVDEHTVVFINSPLSVEQLQAQIPLRGRVITMDLNEMALQHLGRRAAISALLGAVACRLAGLGREAVSQAIASELTELGLPPTVIERNQGMALRCYDLVKPMAIETEPRQPLATARLHTPTYEPPTRGTAGITAGPNSTIRSMSGWRTFRPVLRPDLCNGCWLCFANCPEGAITIKPDGKPAIYYPHCKGCLDCVEVCPTDAMTVEREPQVS